MSLFKFKKNAVMTNENHLPYQNKWLGIKEQLKTKMSDGTINLPSSKLAADILAESILNKNLDIEEMKNSKYKETIKLSNSDNIDDLYLCCQRMADLCQTLNYGPAGLWLGIFCEEILEHYSDAQYWYNKAAHFGDGMGMYRVGLLYLNKKVTLPPQVSLKRCFTDAASYGVPQAQVILDKYFS